ncbi:MAG: hypothetical protein IKK75_03230 [Clostridia bacterium]|nr:hypothetical protein [Clostridia bacterium]
MNYMKVSDAIKNAHTYLKAWVVKRYNLKKIKEATKGTRPLTKEQHAEIDALYGPYARVSHLYHQFYYAHNGIWSATYLPTDLYANRICTYFNSGTDAKVMDNKCLYPVLFNGISQPENAAYRMNGFWFDADRKQIDEAGLRALLDAEPALFVKAATISFGGKGVVYVAADKGSVSEQVMKAVGEMTGDIVVQRPIRQHESISRLNPHAVNTIRVVSLLREGGVKIYSTLLRMGVGTAKVDNASSGGVTCGILEGGRLTKLAFFQDGSSCTEHPETGVVFENYVIPNFDKVLDLVRRAHPMLPHFRLIAWDIALDETGEPVMIETNLTRGGTVAQQMHFGTVFGDDTKAILDEVFGKKK